MAQIIGESPEAWRGVDVMCKILSQMGTLTCELEQPEKFQTIVAVFLSAIATHPAYVAAMDHDGRRNPMNDPQ